VRPLKISVMTFCIVSLSSCSINGQSEDINKPVKISNEQRICEIVNSKFNNIVNSKNRIDRVRAWQLIIDNPICFVSGSVDVANSELKILQDIK
jgi:hypothetical protein